MRTHFFLRSSRNMADLMALKNNCSKSVIGICQMTCSSDKNANFAKAKSLATQCRHLGAQMIFLPEACDFIADSQKQSMEMAETLDGNMMSLYKQLAKDLSIWISIGGFHQKSADAGTQKLLNTHVILDNNGEIQTTYSKAHMFDLDIPDKIRLCETDYTIPGDRIVPPVQSPVGNIGLGICYDVRFPEMSVRLRSKGADILTFPSAFTVPTGMAHWHVLLRNRAIESQCYVIAAAQTGKHNNKRSSYGHSLIVDPWGTVVAECSEGEGICVAEIKLDYLHQIRQQMPVQEHRRPALYAHVYTDAKNCDIDSVPSYTFGKFKIGCKQVFYKTSLSYAFVNIKPVVPGHILVSTIRDVKRFCDLEPAEVSDLFNTVKVISPVIEEHFKGTSLTISVQDGPAAGQTVEHVHVHVLPRKAGDFHKNDDVYSELEHHDKHLEDEKQAGSLRTEQEMNAEAAQLRTYFI